MDILNQNVNTTNISTLEQALQVKQEIFQSYELLDNFTIPQISNLEDKIDNFCLYTSNNIRQIYLDMNQSYLDLFTIKQINLKLIDRERILIGATRENTIFESNLIVSYFDMIDFAQPEHFNFLLKRISIFSNFMIENNKLLTDKENLNLKIIYKQMINKLTDIRKVYDLINSVLSEDHKFSEAENFTLH